MLIAALPTLTAHADEPQGLPVRIAPAAGQPVDGTLLSIDAAHGVTYQTPAGKVTAALDDVCGIVPTNPAAGPINRSPTTAPAGLACMAYLPDGGAIAAQLQTPPEGADAAGKVHIDIGLNQPLTVPLTRLAAIRLTADAQPEGQRELESRLAKRDATRDLMIVLRRGKPTVLPGALEKLSPQGWEFTAGAQTHTGTCDQIYAVVLGIGPTTPRPGPATTHLTNGGRFTGKITWASPETLNIDSEWLGALAVPWSMVRSVLLRSDRIVYVSDLEPSQTDVKTLFDAPWPPQRDANVTGEPLRIGGIAYAKGLGVHANTKLIYSLDGTFEQFLVECGVDDAVAPHGSVVFRVLVDGKPAFASPAVGPGRKPLAISVDLTGASQLTLEASDAGDLDLSDHADWANARLVRKKKNGK